MTDQPGIGDILCHDEKRKYKFIQCDTFHAGTFPSAWETLGVVAMRKGNQVWVVAKENTTKKFLEVYPYIVTGYTLDGEEHTVQLRLHGKPTTTTYYEFTYIASTVDEFVSQLQQFLSTNGETDWSAYLMDGNAILQYDNYASLEYLSASITQAIGMTLNAKIETDMLQVPSIMRKCGNIGHFVWNTAAAEQHFRQDLSAVAYNPSSDVSSEPTYPICWPAFAGTSKYQSDHCLWLRQKYCSDPDNPKIEEWESYIADLAPVSPAMTGGFAPEWRGREEFDKIKDVTYMATDGTQKSLYPGANYCSKFFDGKGYMPSMYEFYEMFKDLTLGIIGVTNQAADPINRSLYAIGGSPIYATLTYFTASLLSMTYIRAASSTGNTDGSNLFNERRCIPILCIDLPVD